MKIESAIFTVRVAVNEDGVSEGETDGLRLDGWTLTSRLGKLVAHQSFDPSILDGRVLSLTDKDVARIGELLERFPKSILGEILVSASVYFFEDECEFSVDPSIMKICLEANARFWLHTFPKGDWR